jgi:hypothetical protein
METRSAILLVSSFGSIVAIYRLWLVSSARKPIGTRQFVNLAITLIVGYIFLTVFFVLGFGLFPLIIIFGSLFWGDLIDLKSTRFSFLTIVLLAGIYVSLLLRLQTEFHISELSSGLDEATHIYYMPYALYYFIFPASLLYSLREYILRTGIINNRKKYNLLSKCFFISLVAMTVLNFGFIYSNFNTVFFVGGQIVLIIISILVLFRWRDTLSQSNFYSLLVIAVGWLIAGNFTEFIFVQASLPHEKIDYLGLFVVGFLIPGLILNVFSFIKSMRISNLKETENMVNEIKIKYGKVFEEFIDPIELLVILAIVITYFLRINYFKTPILQTTGETFIIAALIELAFDFVRRRNHASIKNI